MIKIEYSSRRKYIENHHNRILMRTQFILDSNVYRQRLKINSRVSFYEQD